MPMKTLILAKRRSARAPFVGTLLSLAIAQSSPGEAACPSNPCDCLGEVKNFTLVASKLLVIQEGRQTAYHYDYLAGAYVEGGVCAPRIVASGSVVLPTHFTYGFATAGPGKIAASFSRRIPPGYDGDYGYGVDALGVSTGGGSVKGIQNLSDADVVDTSGTNPGIASCQQAMLDMETASATLAALPPTQNLGTVLVKGTDLDLAAGPGVNVFAADRIYVLPRKDGEFLEGGRIFVETVPTTEAVIINTSGLWIGDVSAIHTTDLVRVIINVVGGGATVKVGRDGFSEAPILAPERSVTLGVQDPELGMSPVLARRVRLKGGTASDNFSACP
jgi:hypothetical protein